MPEESIVKITLFDGTEIDAILNGTTYETENEISQAKLTDENLSEIEIDGATYKNMTLVSFYPWENGVRFALRELSEQEIKNFKLQANIEYIAMMADIDLEEV